MHILDPGPLATVQDLGRRGHRDLGVPLSGAMDPLALQVANGLVGNGRGAAAIEVTWGGLNAALTAGVVFAVTGADIEVMINGEAVPMWTTCRASRGDILTFGSASRGLRSYLAIAGGVEVPLVMGSRSTYIRGGFGGLCGRPLAGGDVIEVGPAPHPPAPFRRAPHDLIPPYADQSPLRVVLGPQEDLITPEGVATFLSEPYRVTDRCDRMGMILSGPRISHRHGPDIVSDGTIPGVVQIPGNGWPAILGADCQTTGGYVKIATVIGADLPLAAQLVPGACVRFKALSLLEAREIYLRRELQLRRFCESTVHTA